MNYSKLLIIKTGLFIWAILLILLFLFNYYNPSKQNSYNLEFNTASNYSENVLSENSVFEPIKVEIENNDTDQIDLINLNNFGKLVNKLNLLSSNFVPQDLILLSEIGIKDSSQVKLVRTAAISLKNMATQMEDKGLYIKIFSGYRSFSEQSSLYANSKEKDITAPPGASEHQLGTAVDITLKGSGLISIYPNGKSTQEWQWLDQNAHLFGWVMSYRFAQENLTGYKFEPWHWRYVGVELATKIRMSENTPESFYQN